MSKPRLMDSNYSDHETYKIFVSTWNVGGVAPAEDFSLEDLLDTRNNTHDIYVIGFQEIVPLSAGNILSVEKAGTSSKISMKWNSLIREALNKPVTTSTSSSVLKTTLQHNQDATNKLGETQKVYPVKDKENSIHESNNNQIIIKQDHFQCILSKQMVGIFISIWVRSNLCPYIRHPSISSVGCGIMGCLGNKGSVSARFLLHETSFCFVCTHLASGGKEGDERHRNSDAMDILSRTSFPRGSSSLIDDLPRKILDHDNVILLGDLNYRISLPEATTRSLVEKKEWEILLEKDQLSVELMDGKVFEGWLEGDIQFPPTYKYYPNSDVYYGFDESKKGEKRRAPAWCDRIIWFGKGLKQNQYDRGEYRLSDHRPVRAIFTSQVKVLRTSKVFKRFHSSLSDRSEQIQIQSEIFPRKTFLY